VLGALRFGRFFRAISVSVVQGMLAGIGLVLISGQIYTMAGAGHPGLGLERFTQVPHLIAGTVTDRGALLQFAVGAGTIAVMVLWKKLPSAARTVPAALVAVALATAVTVTAGLPVPRVDVRGLLSAVQPPGLADFGSLVSLTALGTVVAFVLIASAESLFSAAALDRMHDGPRTHFDKELMAQGVGNTVCGVLGALPLTAVIVRSAANVQAGAKTSLSRFLHGVWLLVFAAFLPAVIGIIPLAALAGVLCHAGCKLIPVHELGRLWREHRGEALVLTATALAIVTTNMFEGVLIGLLLAVVKTAWETSHTRVDIAEQADGGLVVTVTGCATFLRLPRLLDTLDALPRSHRVELDLSQLRYLDHASRTALETWVDWRRTSVGVLVRT
jgi:MFS superfamily sulfate permease-like transporter